MITGTIIFAANLDYEGDGTIDVTIASQRLETHVNLYMHEAAWKDFGKQLIIFPKHVDEVLVFDASLYGMYHNSIRFEAYCYDWQGHTALRIITDNNAANPHRVKLEFSIPVEAGSLNQLGHMLANWQPTISPEIVWQAQTS